MVYSDSLDNSFTSKVDVMWESSTGASPFRILSAKVAAALTGAWSFDWKLGFLPGCDHNAAFLTSYLGSHESCFRIHFFPSTAMGIPSTLVDFQFTQIPRSPLRYRLDSIPF